MGWMLLVDREHRCHKDFSRCCYDGASKEACWAGMITHADQMDPPTLVVAVSLNDCAACS